ncbi:MAG: sensor histidine kinase [Vicinamibacterales bacterium]
MSELLNLVGLSAGVVLYAMLLTMVVRARRRPRASPFDPLLVATALLGLLWNLCALPAYELPKVGVLGPFPLLIAVGFSALGFLPAVVVHSVLRSRRQGLRGAGRRILVSIAYAASVTGALLQMHAAWSGGPMPSVLGMRLLTYTFVGLIVPLAASTKGQPGARRALWAAALAAFAVSALHLSQLHRGDASWPIELLGHHASVPLALAILYQDYPFALADLFLKRALALIALLAIAFAAIGIIGRYSPILAQLGPRQVGVLVTIWVTTALAYPALRRSIAWFVDAVVLHRPDYRSFRRRIARRLQTHDTVPSLLDDLCASLAPALSARRVGWTEWDHAPADEQGGLIVETDEAHAVVPTTDLPRYRIAISDITGGRRFFSDDVGTIEAVVVLAARRIDAIRITNERYQRQIRDEEMQKLASQAELRTLRAQLNPHFLFNALTTIGYLIEVAPARALSTLMRLTSLLRAVLRSEGELTTLGRELEVVQAYLDIERARFEQRLRFTIDVEPQLAALRVPSLVLQPLVENAVKHGISRRRQGGEVAVAARIVDGPAPQLLLTVSDTGAGVDPDALEIRRGIGVGLRNLERRLHCIYGAAAGVSIASARDAGMLVEVRLPAERREAPAAVERAAR